MTIQPRDRVAMAARVATDIPEGWWVNLGIGIPVLVADHVPLEREVVFHSENGVLGMGPAPEPGAVDPWLINAGKTHVTLRPGGSYVHQADSFAIIRGGHLDLCVLGAFEVAENGDIANWSRSDNDFAPAVGGAMDLAVGRQATMGGDGAHDKVRRAAAGRALHLSVDGVGCRQPGLHQPGGAGRDGARFRRRGHRSRAGLRRVAAADGR